MTRPTRILLVLLLLSSVSVARPLAQDGDALRPFRVSPGDKWSGESVCYGPHRDGQRPGGTEPSRAELREDLQIIARDWPLLRIYGASEFAADMLEVIREDALALDVVLGVWIAPAEPVDESERGEDAFAAARAANAEEVAAAIRLANEFPDIVSAVCVGNETQIFWSGHRSPMGTLIRHVRTVRDAIEQPVTVADDFNFWNTPASRPVAAEVDFILMHAHPMWNGLQLENAVPWLRQQLDVVRALHGDRPVFVGETGWATMVHDQGEQAELIRGAPGESEQLEFRRALQAWLRSEPQVCFLFEAFDENWKGGEHPNEVEKHWGLYRADRSPKAAITGSAVD